MLKTTAAVVAVPTPLKPNLGAELRKPLNVQ